jgi:hypothetical protein
VTNLRAIQMEGRPMMLFKQILEFFWKNDHLTFEMIISLLLIAGVGYFTGSGQYEPALFAGGLALGQIFLLKREFTLLVAAMSFLALGVTSVTMLVFEHGMSEEFEVFLMMSPAILGFGFTCVLQLGSEIFRAQLANRLAERIQKAD